MLIGILWVEKFWELGINSIILRRVEWGKLILLWFLIFDRFGYLGNVLEISVCIGI